MRVKSPSWTRLRPWAYAALAAAYAILMTVAVPVALSPRPPLLEGVPFSTAWQDRHGKLLRLSLAADERYRLFTPLRDISPDIVAATLTQEDRYFYRHPGVNPFSLVRAAFATYVLRGRPIGGSTVSMQVVRLRDGLDTRGIGGKLTQVFRALQLERHYTKDQILEAYLNLAPYGGNIHGAGTAAQIYFGQPAHALAGPQSLALAVIPQNPVRRFPLNDDRAAWNDARRRLFPQMPASWQRHAAVMNLELPVRGRGDLPFLAPHLIDSLGPRDGGTVRTTIDAAQQSLVERRLAAWLRHEDPRNLGNAAAMLVHLPTMEVRALAGSADFHDSATRGQVDGTAARRSPGSALKPFVYALALEQGLIHPETLLADDPAFFAEYRPGNFDDRFIGRIPAREALVLSRNVPAIALAARLDNPGLYEFLQRAGAAFPHGRRHYGLSIVLGGAEIDMRTLVRLYAMLANGGMLRDLVYVAGQPAGPAHPALSPEAALLTVAMLERPDPGRLPFTVTPPLPLYWKTGTSNGFRDAWTIGIFGDYVLAVWLGHFDGRPSPALVGVDAAAPLFFDLATALAAREPSMADRIKPALEKLNIARIPICRRTGAPDDCADRAMGWFIPGKSPFALTPPGLRPPEILSPRGGVSYVHSRRSAEPLRIPLEAKAAPAQRPVYWFADNVFIGAADGAVPLFWTPPAGRHVLRAVDAHGRAASQPITVVSAE